MIRFIEPRERVESMAWRELGQLSLADSLVSGVGQNATLDHLAELIDWAALAELVSPLDPLRRGAPGYPALVLLKALFLQQWHGLSDPGLEAALADRLSFRRFCGFALDDKTPDHVTIHRFREGLRRHGLAERDGRRARYRIIARPHGDARRAGLAVPEAELREIDPAAILHRLDEILAGHRLSVMPLEIEIGALAEAIRPDSYREISNFYTATVYNKGAEVIRMMRTMVGTARFREGTDLYFERHEVREHPRSV